MQKKKKFGFKEHDEKIRLLGELQQAIGLDLVVPNKKLPTKIVFWHIPTMRKNLDRYCQVIGDVEKFLPLGIAIQFDFYTQEFVVEEKLIAAIERQGGNGKYLLQQYDLLFE